MSNQHGGKAVQRSWTEQEQPTNKWYTVSLLAISLITALGLYFYFKPTQLRHATFFASLTCAEYGDYFPMSPRWGSWRPDDLQAISNRCGEAGLKPWELLKFDAASPDAVGGANVQSKQQFNSALTNISSLNKSRIAPEHTVVLQIRCHGLVGQKDSTWSCGLHLGESGDSKEDILWIDELLASLSQLKAKNIILLADICDIRHLPERGLVANPIASYLKQACEKFAAPNNVWVICAAGDCQAAHYSDVARKTLFQEACEHAFRKPTKEKSRFLSLADYFGAVREYCSIESAGQQTPVMMRAGASDYVGPADSLAQQVIVNSFGRTIKATATQAPANNKEAAKDASDAKSPPAVAAGDIKNFWQFKDQVSWDLPARCGTPTPTADNNGKPATEFKWHPAAFAPEHWRQLQRSVARSPAIGDSINPDHLREFMNCFASESRCDEFPGVLQPLARSWNHFVATNLNRAKWTHPNDFVGNDFDRWKALRSEYAEYIASINELLFWRELAIELPDEFESSYTELLDAMRSEKLKLPDATGDFALHESSAIRVGKPRARLIDRLNQLVAGLQDESSWRKKIWTVERTCQTLLHSPLLCSDQRQELDVLMRRDVGRARNNADWFERVSQQTSNRFASRSNVDPVGLITRFSTSLTTLWSSRTLGAPGNDVASLRLTEPKEFSSELERWHAAALCDNFNLVASGNSTAGIIVLPCDPAGIQFVADPTTRINFQSASDSREFGIDIKRVAQDDFELSWRGSNLPEEFSMQIQGQSLKNGQRIRVPGNSKRITLALSRNSTKPLASNTAIELLTFDKDKATGSIRIPVVVDEEHFELIAIRKNENGPQDIPASLMAGSRAQGAFDLPSPALQDASSRFSFALRNKLPRPRRAVVRLYALDDSNLGAYVTALSSSGAAVAGELVKSLVAESTPMDLPPFDGSMRRVDVKFVSKGAAASNPPGSGPDLRPTASDVHLVFWIEEQPPTVDPASAPGLSAPVLTSTVFIGRAEPLRPSELRFERQNAVTCVPIVGTVGQRVQIEAKIPNEKFWELYEIGKLSIDARFYVDSTTEIDRQQIELNPKQPTTSLLGPILEADVAMRVELDVGGFPRALVYQFNRSSGRFERTFPPLVRIEQGVVPIIEGSDVLRSQAEKAIRESQAEVSGVTVFPTMIDGQVIKYTGLTFTAKLDAGQRNEAQLVIRKDSQVSRRTERPWRTTPLITDRRYVPSFAIVNGDLKIGIAPGEWQTNLDLPAVKDSIIEFELISSNQRQSTTVILDSTPPQRCAFTSPKSRTMNEGSSLTFSIEVRDGGEFGSGIEQVEVALSAERAGVRFPKKPSGTIVMAEPEEQSSKRWRVNLDAEYFKDMAPGVYQVYARATDRAGNREDLQDNENYLRINWVGSSAKSKTKKK